MISSDQHRIVLECDCQRCSVDRHWEAVSNQYIAATRQHCVGLSRRSGWEYEGDKHYAPGHLQEFGRLK